MAAADTTDVAIIGGGIMGSAVALRLAQRGVSVTVVERGIPGAEASSAAAGILGPQMEAEGPGPLLDLGLASRALYPSLAAELREATGIDVGYDRSGVLAAALDDAGEGELAERRAWQQRRSLNVGWLSGDEVRAREPALGPGDPRRAGVSRRRAGQRARAGARVLAGGGGRGRALPHRPLRATRGRRTRRGHRPGAGRRDAAGGHGRGRGGELVRADRGRRRAVDRRAPGARPARVDRDAPAAVPPRRLRARRLPGSAPRRHRAGGQHGGDGRLPQAGDRRRPGRDPDAGAHAGAGAVRGARDGDLVELPPLHGGPPAGAGRDAGARPGARDRALPQRHPAGAGHGRGDRRAGGDGAVGDRSRAVFGGALRADSRTPLPNPLPAARGEGIGSGLPLPLAGEGRGEGKPL